MLLVQIQDEVELFLPEGMLQERTGHGHDACCEWEGSPEVLYEMMCLRSAARNEGGCLLVSLCMFGEPCILTEINGSNLQ